MDFNNLNPNATMASAPTETASTQDGQTSLPQYITTQQFQQIFQQAKSKGLSDPGALAQTLVEHGHILQGLNDQNYQAQTAQSDNQNQPQNQSILGKVGSFIGNTAQSIAQPFETAAGSAIRGVQATPDIVKGIFGDRQAQQQAEQTLEKPMFGQKTAAAMNNKELLGTAAKTASFLVPVTKLGTVASGAVIGGMQGGGEAAVENKTGNEIIGSTALGAAGGAILGKAIGKVAPLLTRSEGSSEDVALNAYKSGLKSVQDYTKTISNEFRNGAIKIGETDPTAGVQLNLNEVQNIQQIAKNSGVKLPKALQTDFSAPVGSTAEGAAQSQLGQNLPIAKLNAVDTQDLISALNKKWKIPDAAALADDIHSKASQTFGPEFDTLYKNYSTQIRGVQSLSDIFDAGNKAPTASDLSSSMNQISKLLNDKQGSVVLKNVLNDFHQISGIDLTNQTQAIAAVNKIKNPALKQAGKLLLKGIAIAGEGTIFGKAANLFH